MREGLKRILNDCEEMRVTGEADRGETAIEMAKAGHLDLVILDLSLPGRGGIEALKELRRRWPRLPVLVLSMYPEDQYGLRALRAGASGYVMKERSPEEMIAAVRKIVAGGTHVSPELAERLALHVADVHRGRAHEKLSDREDQVLRLLVKGMAVKDIAKALGLNVKTVSEYKRRILSKLRLRTLAEVMQYAFANNLVPKT